MNQVVFVSYETINAHFLSLDKENSIQKGLEMYNIHCIFAQKNFRSAFATQQSNY